MHKSHEDQPMEHTHEDLTELFPSLATAPNNPASAPQTPARRNRRKFISLLVVGAVGVATAVTVGGVTFAREVEGGSHGDGKGTGVIVKRQGDDGEKDGKDGEDGKHPHKTPTPSKTPTTQPTPNPTAQPTTAPTPKPTTAPSGTVIGSTSQAANTAVAFTNPADGQASWLVHMSNGNFVAVEQACTHAGVAVKYNASTGQFNCPAHGAIFNADGTNPQAPATKPLPSVHVTVNANGTITTP